MSTFNPEPSQCAQCGDVTPCEFCSRCQRYFCGCTTPDGVLCSHPDCGAFVCDECAGALESRLSVCREHLEYGAEVLRKELREARRRIEAAAVVLVIADENTDFTRNEAGSYMELTPETMAVLAGSLAGTVKLALMMLRK